MKVLVIGGTRFIGWAVVQTLLRRGHEVAVFNRGKTEAELPAAVTRITGEVDQLAQSAAALRAFAPEVVLHNIVLHDGHVRDVQTVFDGVARKLVMTSSMDVYLPFGRLLGKESGDLITGELDETSPVRTVLYPYRNDEMPADHRLYHYDKIPAEQAALNHSQMAGTVLRLPMVLGEQDWQRRLLPFIKPMQDGRQQIVLDEVYARWRSTYGYVENVAQAMVLAAEDDRANGRIYNVADTIAPTLTLAEQVRQIMQWQGEFIIAPAEKLPAALHFDAAVPQDLAVKAERIRQELDYAPVVDFAEGVRRAVAWEIANPPNPFPDALLDYSAQDEALKTLGYS